MAYEVGLWRIGGSGEPVRVTSGAIPLESQLETLIAQDPTILGEPLMIIGRQVPTDFGGFVDLLGIDGDGTLHVLELKRGRTPREVVAQILDYASWVKNLSHDDVLAIYGASRQESPFETAFSALFGVSPPDELNADHRLTIVAHDADPATERIVSYLSSFAVPVNVAFFRYFEDEGRRYLARTWLIDETKPSRTASVQRRSGTKETWNGQDWYVALGEDETRAWDDARKYGFVSAGGGTWFSRTLISLPSGARIFTHIPKAGYVGVGTVTGEARPAHEAILEIDGELRRFTDLELKGSYRHKGDEHDETLAEYIVPVTWIQTVPRDSARWAQGMFANQNSACKLRNKFTLDHLYKEFNLTDLEG
ncbi:endonuclease NucS domain-containing protein [Streptosporangium saharense]|uniref:endonuclease NucS domain-containing protein n=1 Tax=Streptosporangium saharense TaxID=1706840 RepID=UPI003691A18A